MTQQIKNKRLSSKVLAFACAACVAPMAANAQSSFEDFDYGAEPQARPGVYYEINPFTGQAQRHHGGDSGAIQNASEMFMDDYASVDAQITGVRTVDTPNGERTLAKAKLTDGRFVVVDLGPSAAISELDFQDGDIVSLRGRGSAPGLMVADQLTVDGQAVALNAADIGETDVIVLDTPEESSDALATAQ